MHKYFTNKSLHTYHILILFSHNKKREMLVQLTKIINLLWLISFVVSVKALPIAENTDLIKRGFGNSYVPVQQCYPNVNQNGMKGVPITADVLSVQYNYDIDSYLVTINFKVTDPDITIENLNELKWLNVEPYTESMIFSRNLQLFPDLNLQDFTISAFFKGYESYQNSNALSFNNQLGLQFDFCQYNVNGGSSSVGACSCWNYGSTSFDYYFGCNTDNYCNSQNAWPDYIWPKECQQSNCDVPSLIHENTYQQSYCSVNGYTSVIATKTHECVTKCKTSTTSTLHSTTVITAVQPVVCTYTIFTTDEITHVETLVTKSNGTPTTNYITSVETSVGSTVTTSSDTICKATATTITTYSTTGTASTTTTSTPITVPSNTLVVSSVSSVTSSTSTSKVVISTSSASVVTSSSTSNTSSSSTGSTSSSSVSTSSIQSSTSSVYVSTSSYISTTSKSTFGYFNTTSTSVSSSSSSAVVSSVSKSVPVSSGSSSITPATSSVISTISSSISATSSVVSTSSSPITLSSSVVSTSVPVTSSVVSTGSSSTTVSTSPASTNPTTVTLAVSSSTSNVISTISSSTQGILSLTSSTPYSQSQSTMLSSVISSSYSLVSVTSETPSISYYANSGSKTKYSLVTVLLSLVAFII